LASSLLWQQAWQRVRADILGGRLAAGERINEARLARQYGISRNPLREALRQLIQEGLVAYRPNLGTVVAEVPPQDVRTAMEIRVFLETRAADRLLAEGRFPEILPRLEKVVRAMARLGGAAVGGEPEELDARFHGMIIEASGSPLLRRMWALTDPYAYMMDSGREPGSKGRRTGGREHSLRHRRLLDAFSSGDQKAVRRALEAHIRGVAPRDGKGRKP